MCSVNTNRCSDRVRFIYLVAVFSSVSLRCLAQEDLLSLVEEAPQKEFVTSAFKTTRIINTHSAELLSAGTLDLRIQHRFGTLNSGVNNLYGLDEANMRLGFDYGIMDRLMVGVGRSNVNKELDGFIKYKLLWQSTGPKSTPLSAVLVAGSTLTTAPYADPTRTNFFSARMSYYWQVLLARKFSESLTLQLTPSLVHHNMVPTKEYKHDVYSLGFGGRLKLTRRVSFNWDYQYVFPGLLPKGYENFVAVGFDIETGGHVFQIMVTNSMGMNEKAFITGTTDKVSEMGLRLGFNLSRVFTIGGNSSKGK